MSSPGLQLVPDLPQDNPRVSKTRLVTLALLLVAVLGALFGRWMIDSVAMAQDSAESEASSLPLVPDAEWPDPDTIGMREILDGLRARERSLERREQTLMAREADLRQVEVELQQRLGELEAAREAMEELLASADEARDARIRALVKMVESMRSQQAAGVVTELDDELAVSVLSRMNRTKAGKLLAAMNASRAATLAEKLANEPAR